MQKNLRPLPSGISSYLYPLGPENIHSHTHLASSEGIFFLPGSVQLKSVGTRRKMAGMAVKALSTFAHVSSWSREGLIASKLGSWNSTPTNIRSLLLSPHSCLIPSHQVLSIIHCRCNLGPKVAPSPYINLLSLATGEELAASGRTVDIFSFFFSSRGIISHPAPSLQASPFVLHPPVLT